MTKARSFVDVINANVDFGMAKQALQVSLKHTTVINRLHNSVGTGLTGPLIYCLSAEVVAASKYCKSSR